MQNSALWLLRALWFTLPLTVGPGISDAVDDQVDGTRWSLLILAWIAWLVGLLATALPLPSGLTALRLGAPGVAAAAIWSLFDTGPGNADAIVYIGVAAAIVLATVAFSSLVGDSMVDGASYGDERRMLLRPPAGLAAIVVPVTGAATIAGIVAGPVLLAHRQWILGTVLVIVGFAVAWLGARALHQLTRRWIVFVPNGFVLHDLTTLTEPVLFRRTAVERVGPALAGTPARDLSAKAAGLMLECELTDPAPLGLRTPGAEAAAELTDVRRFLFTPSRPGALLDEAERRKLPVG